MAEEGFACFGTEIPSFSFADAETGHESGSIPIVYKNGKIEDLRFDSDFFDAVSIWHVLEHVRDPRSTLSEISRVLKPNGILMIAVPNYGSIQAALFGKHWFHRDLPRHLYHFTRECLLERLTEFGMEAILVETRSIDQNILGFIQSAENLIFSGKRANAFYFLLKFQKRATLRAFGWIQYGCLALILLPPAILEDLIFTSLGLGATLIIYAKKQA
jgi:SAM-dependent methyltransferase